MKKIFCFFFLLMSCHLSATEWEGLKSENWHPQVRGRLEAIIRAEAGSKKPVVFDLDDTILARDIADATLALLVRDGILTKDQILKSLTPTFFLSDKYISIDNAIDLVEYGQWIQKATLHQRDDLSPNICFYSWVALILNGLTCDQVVQATREAYQGGIASMDFENAPHITKIWATPEKTSYSVPFVRAEMAELLAAFLMHDYDVWVVSASPVLIARTVVLSEVNKLIATFGTEKKITADHIIGISTLMQGDDGKLYKDYPLVTTDNEYANLEETALSRYKLTTILTPPVTGYGGKVAAIAERIGRFPYFGAGDTMSDMPFLKLCQHKLWMAKLDSPQLQGQAKSEMREADIESFLLQPVLSKKAPCFVTSSKILNNLLTDESENRWAKNAYLLFYYD